MYRLFRWESPEGEDPHQLVLRSDEEALVMLSDVGLQLAVSFSGAGSVLATGGEVNECPTAYCFIENYYRWCACIIAIFYTIQYLFDCAVGEAPMV